MGPFHGSVIFIIKSNLHVKSVTGENSIMVLRNKRVQYFIISNIDLKMLSIVLVKLY